MKSFLKNLKEISIFFLWDEKSACGNHFVPQSNVLFMSCAHFSITWHCSLYSSDWTMTSRASTIGATKRGNFSHSLICACFEQFFNSSYSYLILFPNSVRLNQLKPLSVGDQTVSNCSQWRLLSSSFKYPGGTWIELGS